MGYEIEKYLVGPRAFTDTLFVKVIHKVPSGATVNNPDGKSGDEFELKTPVSNIKLDFVASKGTGGIGTNTIKRRGKLTDLDNSTYAKSTIARLLLGTSEEDKKSKTQDQYEVNPPTPFIEDPKNQG